MIPDRRAAMRRRMRASSAALLAIGGTAVLGAAGSTTRVELRVEPVLDLYFHARALADDDDAVVPEPYRAAIDALGALEEKLGSGFLAWGVVDRQTAGVVSLDELAQRFDLVEPLRARDGGSVPITEELRAVVKALRSAEAHHQSEIWPIHWRLVESARRRLETSLLPAQGDAFAYMLRSLGMRDPGKVIPVYLSAKLPWPGGFTYALPSGAGVCFVGVDRPEFAGTGLAELILHEATHALDVESAESVLERLRARLREAGFTPADRVLRDAPHTLMFVQAGETIRRHVSPEHTHYGDGTSTYYRRVPLAPFEKELWVRHLDGEIALDDAIERIVEEARRASR